MPPVGGHDLLVGLVEVGCLEEGEGTPAEQFGATHLELLGQFVEAPHEVVVELYQYLLARHDHMVNHM